ncbi:MAG: UMP kinase, partial [Deltaproteobacteria bacterium]|nr:UMP kinase [Deltaproteobacteria bacterium]
MGEPVYNNVLIKVSGEMLAGEGHTGIDNDMLAVFAEELHRVNELGVKTSVIIGGGNIFRGLAGAAQGMDR